MRRVALMLSWILILATGSAAKTGNDWRQMPKEMRMAYVWGVVDTWQNLENIRLLSSKEYPEGPSIFTPLVQCMGRGMNYGQIAAIVEKYMENNPSDWHYDMAVLVWNAVDKACTPTPPTTTTPPVKK